MASNRKTIIGSFRIFLVQNYINNFVKELLKLYSFLNLFQIYITEWQKEARSYLKNLWT